MPRPWRDKFRDAFRGLWLAIRNEKCFVIHLPAAIAVLVAAIVLRVTLPEACILGLCVTIVLAAESFNTAIEFLAREVAQEKRPGLGAALDMASGAVLITALGAAAVGGSIFLYRLGVLLHWWT